MKAKRITAFFMALTLAVALSACGNISTAQEIMANDVEIEESEEIESEELEVIESEEAKTEEVAESEATVEDELVESEETEPVETAKPAETAEPKTEKTETVKTETSAPAQSAKPTAEPTAKPTAQPTAEPTAEPVVQSEVPAATPAPAPVATPTPEPVHQHSWKEHIATNQVWVPNIVVVDDYEEKTVVDDHKGICYCGFEFTDGEVYKQHVKDAAKAGESGHTGFTIEEHTHTEQVWVGSHEEDQGHYETNSYVDYYYCDCGERK